MIGRKLALTLLIGASLCVASLAHADDVQKRTIRWGHLLNKDHPLSAGVQKFAELAAKKSGGKFKVREFPSSQLGSELQQQSALQGGSQEMMSAATSTLAGIVPEYGILDFPFIFANEEEADKLLDGKVGNMLGQKLAKHGLIGLGFWENGFRNVTNSRRPITKPEDLSGLKIRVMPNPVYLQTFQAVNANPIPLAFSELFTALETGAVDAQENPYAIILSNRFNEVQKYLSVTNHTYNAFAVIVSKVFWDKLSPAEQRILQESAVEARAYQREVSRKASRAALDELKQKGMEMNTLEKEQLVRMREITQPVIDKFAASYDQELVKAFYAEVEKIRGN